MVVNTEVWAGLADDLKAIVEAAALQCAMETLGQFDYMNVGAMKSLADGGVEFLSFPDEVVAAMKTAWGEVLEEQRAASADAARVLESYEAYQTGAVPYANAFIGRYMAAR